MKENRLDYLDSIRGLAAFSVLIYHFIFSLDTFHYWDGSVIQYYLAMIFNGADAVSLFFVLSGLVLSYKYFNSENNKLSLNYSSFVIQRIFRIYPAFLVMICIYFLYVQRDYLSIDFFYNSLVHEDHNFLREALLIKGVHNYYIPGWTLGVEMALSLFVPVFVIIAVKSTKMLYWLIAISFIMSSIVSMFLFHFLLGILIGKKFEVIKNYDFNSSKIYKVRWVVYFLVFILYSIRFIDHISPLGAYYTLPEYYLGLSFFQITGVASYFILLKAINSMYWQNILRWNPLLFLGKISYSLYLTHWFAVFCVFVPRPDKLAHWIHLDEHPYLAGFIICIPLTILMSFILYHSIEKPFNLLGKKISKKYFPDNSNGVTV